MRTRDKIIAITPFVALIAFIILATYGYAHPGWLVFLLIPLMPFAVGKDKIRITYPLITIIIYVVIGVFFQWWHPGWVIFLTIPVYYILVTPKKVTKRVKNDIFDTDDF